MRLLLAGELAWCAGFIDGKGSFLADRRNLVPSLTLGQSGSPELLYRMVEALGIGKVNGPYQRPGRQPIWRYSLGGFESVQAAAASVWPWLGRVKREQAVRALVPYREQWRPQGWYWREQTQCIHGHPLSGDNVRVTRSGQRKCLICVKRNNDARPRKGDRCASF